MGQEEGPLTPTEIPLSEYKSEGETSIGSALLLDTPSPYTPLSPSSPSLLWDAWDMNNFFLLFSDFIGILFSFSFILDDEEARDIAVT